MAKNFKKKTVIETAHDLAINRKTEKDVKEGMEKLAQQPNAESETKDNAPEESVQPDGEIVGARIVPTKGVQVRMPEDVYMKMMMYKLQHRGITLQDIVIGACKEWLERRDK